MMTVHINTSSADDMADFAKRCAQRWPQSAFCCFLKGDLGTGKSTFVRGFLREMGIQGAIKSPTFGVMEAYHHQGKAFMHMDLYRIQDVYEIDALDIPEIIATQTCFIEWPELLNDFNIRADITLAFSIAPSGTHVVTIDGPASWIDAL